MLVALFVALGTSGYAARLVRRALFAKRAGNASKVDGLSAPREPRPHRLPALNSRGKARSQELDFR
jgi:hypothetical protein